MHTIFGCSLNGPLRRSQPKVPTANFVDATADLTKRFEDFCILESTIQAMSPKCQCPRMISVL